MYIAENTHKKVDSLFFFKSEEIYLKIYWFNKNIYILLWPWIVREKKLKNSLNAFFNLFLFKVLAGKKVIDIIFL